MEIERKKAEILNAVRNLKVSKRQIDPKGKGKAVKKLEDGEKLTEEKINEMYKKLIEMVKRSGKEPARKQKTEKEAIANTLQEVLQK